MNKGAESAATRASIAWLATQSRPGSLEARKVHGCTCIAIDDRHREWDPNTAFSWVDAISACCPAHGRLLDSWRETRRPFLSPVYRRTFTERLGDAIQGWLLGWRGDL